MGEVTLREIDRDNLRAVLSLKVAPEQESFVASNAWSLAEAHFEPVLPWFRAIYAGETPVGFVMVEYDEPERTCNLWRLMIAAPHQGKGYGKRVLELILEHVRTLPWATALYTSCVPEDGGPGPFYEKLGFAYTGEEEDGELWMRLGLEKD
jgi:diamine N-acetyltransferase